MVNDRRQISMLVASHKLYDMPGEEMYLPIWVGARLNAPKRFTPDDTGDNISVKNRNFCELTAVYWAWKNLEADNVGLCHYRRYFKGSFTFVAGGRSFGILSTEETLRLLERHPVILPKKRDYYIETTYSQYAHAHHAIDLDTARRILVDRHPGYVEAFDSLMKKTSGHKFNMFVMRKDIFDSYCNWLFDVLFEMEKRLDISEYSVNDSRVFGFVAERLLDVWMETNSIDYCEVPVINLENQHWVKKAFNFLKRKFAGR
jgi:hypothetical protein